MNKSTIKRQSYNVEILNRLNQKYGVSIQFIRMSLKGDRCSDTSEAIKKDYQLMEKEIEHLLKNL